MKNINSLLLSSASRYGNKTALISSKNDTRLSYNNLATGIKNYSQSLSESGITAGMNVAIRLKKSEHWVMIFFGLLNLHAVPVLIDAQSTERETVECLDASGTKAIISDRTMMSITGIVEIFIIFNENNSGFSCIKVGTETSIARKEKPADAFSKIILFTYRGYGYPLAVLFDERALIKSVFGNIDATKVDDRVIISDIIPSTHIFSLTTSLLSILFVGGTVVMLNNVMPGEILRNMEKYSVNLIIAVPSLIRILCAAYRKKPYDLSRCVKGTIGGNSFSADLFEEWRKISNGGILVQGYGLTETSPAMCNAWDDYKTESMGKPISGVNIRIMKNGKQVKKNEEGILFIKRKGMMEQYINGNNETERLYIDGWFDTGDIVRKGNDGFYYFIRRNKEIAKVGGATVDLNEIKKVILSYDGITDTKLKIETDPVWQEKIVCNITSEKQISKEDIYDYLRLNLSPAKIPKEIIITVKSTIQ